MSTVLERRVVGDKTYEVRRVGGALRLYTNGVLHTHADPKKPIAGRVWDLLALPGIVSRAGRVLVLGVAGGAAIGQLLAFGAPTHIDAVDLDATHLALGKAHFGLDDPRVCLHHADARDFVAAAGPKYDLVIDDVFAEHKGEPYRAIRYDAAWGAAVYTRLSRRGVLVVNSAGRHELPGTVLRDAGYLSRFASVLALETETAGNVVCVLSRQALDARTLRREARTRLGDDYGRLRMTARTVARRG